MKKLLHAFVLSSVLFMTTAHGAKNSWKKRKRMIFKGAALIAVTCASGVAAWYGFNVLKNFWVQRNASEKPVGGDNDTVPEPNPERQPADKHSQNQDIPAPLDEAPESVDLKNKPDPEEERVTRTIYEIGGKTIWDTDWFKWR